jgi:hypothetical protein
MGTEFFRTSEDDTVILSADKGRVWINRNGVKLGSAMKGKQLAQLFNKYQIANWMQSSSIGLALTFGYRLEYKGRVYLVRRQYDETGTYATNEWLVLEQTIESKGTKWEREHEEWCQTYKSLQDALWDICTYPDYLDAF